MLGPTDSNSASSKPVTGIATYVYKEAWNPDHIPNHYPAIPLCYQNELEIIGMGGFGCVYKAVYKGEIIVIKTSAWGVRHEKEILYYLKNLSCPNVVRLHNLDVKESNIIIMEYMDKGDLYDFIPQYKHNPSLITWDIRYKIIHDAANGLYCLHEAGIIHRDLKTDNILLTGEITAKIGDLGCSIEVDDPNSKISAAYPPLLWQSFDYPQTQASDIYNFALILWAITSWQKEPYAEFMDQETKVFMEHIKSGKREAIADETPDWLKTLIKKSWVSDSCKRPTSEQVWEKIKENVNVDLLDTAIPVPPSL